MQSYSRSWTRKASRVNPGQMGENITTSGVDILNLPKGSQLLIGPEVVIEATGFRNPCIQLDSIQKGLMQAVLDKDENGNLMSKAGIMAIVIKSGVISSGDKIIVNLPDQPYIKMEKV